MRNTPRKDAAIYVSLTMALAHILKPQSRIWLVLSLLICLLYSGQSLGEAFEGPYVIQDDARQHIFWMQRYVDPTLFPQDLIADYFQSVAPPGYKAFYYLWTRVGMDPLFISKLLPALLGVITTGYYFGVSVQIFPIRAGAFLACLLLNQALWMEDDLVSATPRAFLYPLFAAFLYYLLQRAVVPCIAAIVALALFYPQMALLGLAVLTLRLLRWSVGLKFTLTAVHWQLWAGGLVSVALILGLYQLTSTEFGPLITVTQAQQLPIFNQVDDYFGRAFYFHENPFLFWLVGPRTGLVFWGLMSPLMLAALALPISLIRHRRSPLTQTTTSEVSLLGQICLGAVGLYLLAHLVAFQLHFPNRYVYHGARFVLPIAASAALISYGAPRLRYFLSKPQRSQPSVPWRHLWQWLQFSLATALILIPLSLRFSVANQLYITGRAPELYAFLHQQPPSTLVASIDREADNLPTFAHRPILVGREYALPYHWGYFQPFQHRALSLITAHYTTDLTLVQAFNREFGIDFWLLRRDAFDPGYVRGNRLIQEFQKTSDSLAALESGSAPALAQLVPLCTRLATDRYVLLDAACMNVQSPLSLPR